MSLDDEWSRYLINQLAPKVEYNNPKEVAVVPAVIEDNEPPPDDFSELIISTKTKVLFLNQPVDINGIFWKIPMLHYWEPKEGVVKKQMKVISKTPEELVELQQNLTTVSYYTENIISQINNPTARRIKFKDERKITVGLSRKDIVNTRGKVKNAFYNCFAMILRFNYDGKFKEIHVKVFNTGKLEIPGVINVRLLDAVKAQIERIMQPHMTTPIIFIENIKHDNVLINSNFSTGFSVNRDKLHTILRSEKYGIESAYDPCSYPGIKCKFYFNNKIGFTNIEQQRGQVLPEDRHMKMSELMDSKKYTEISFMIFRTGSGLIVGNCTDKILFHVFEYIKNILITEYANIRVLNPTAGVKEKPFRMRKRFVYMSPEYYYSVINQRAN
jgi:hypothetical protein